MLRVVTILVVVLGLNGHSAEAQQKDPQQVEFEKKFQREAVLVKTCPGDPRYASGPTAVAQRVYRFQKELWYQDVNGYRKVEATPETVCSVLTQSR
jgi:hypothetical protein